MKTNGHAVLTALLSTWWQGRKNPYTGHRHVTTIYPEWMLFIYTLAGYDKLLQVIPYMMAIHIMEGSGDKADTIGISKALTHIHKTLGHDGEVEADYEDGKIKLLPDRELKIARTDDDGEYTESFMLSECLTQHLNNIDFEDDEVLPIGLEYKQDIVSAMFSLPQYNHISFIRRMLPMLKYQFSRFSSDKTMYTLVGDTAKHEYSEDDAFTMARAAGQYDELKAAALRWLDEPINNTQP